MKLEVFLTPSRPRATVPPTWEEMDGEVLEPALVSVSGAVALFEIFDVVSGLYSGRNGRRPK